MLNSNLSIMNAEHHKKEIDQIKKHVKMLNITGGIAIGALALSGFLLVSDVLESNPDSHIINSSNPEMEIQETESPLITEVKPEELNKQETYSVQSESKNSNPLASSNKAAIRETDSKETKSMNLEEELQSFEASCSNGAISFHWITSGGSKYAFEIEKTYDHVNFEVFSRAPQPEKKDGKNVYSVEETATDNDDAFYRLRKVVGRGKYEYSEAVKVKCTGSTEQPAFVDVFPNGNGSFRIVIIASKAGPYKVSLSDVNDAQLATEEFQAQQGNNEFILTSATEIIKGNYTLRVSNDSMVKEKKVVLK